MSVYDPTAFLSVYARFRVQQYHLRQKGEKSLKPANSIDVNAALLHLQHNIHMCDTVELRRELKRLDETKLETPPPPVVLRDEHTEQMIAALNEHVVTCFKELDEKMCEIRKDMVERIDKAPAATFAKTVSSAANPHDSRTPAFGMPTFQQLDITHANIHEHDGVINSLRSTFSAKSSGTILPEDAGQHVFTPHEHEQEPFSHEHIPTSADCAHELTVVMETLQLSPINAVVEPASPRLAIAEDEAIPAPSAAIAPSAPLPTPDMLVLEELAANVLTTGFVLPPEERVEDNSAIRDNATYTLPLGQIDPATCPPQTLCFDDMQPNVVKEAPAVELTAVPPFDNDAEIPSPVLTPAMQVDAPSVTHQPIATDDVHNNVQNDAPPLFQLVQVDSQVVAVARSPMTISEPDTQERAQADAHAAEMFSIINQFTQNRGEWQDRPVALRNSPASAPPAEPQPIPDIGTDIDTFTSKMPPNPTADMSIKRVLTMQDTQMPPYPMNLRDRRPAVTVLHPSSNVDTPRPSAAVPRRRPPTQSEPVNAAGKPHTKAIGAAARPLALRKVAAMSAVKTHPVAAAKHINRAKLPPPPAPVRTLSRQQEEQTMDPLLHTQSIALTSQMSELTPESSPSEHPAAMPTTAAAPMSTTFNGTDIDDSAFDRRVVDPFIDMALTAEEWQPASWRSHENVSFRSRSTAKGGAPSHKSNSVLDASNDADDDAYTGSGLEIFQLPTENTDARLAYTSDRSTALYQ